MLLFSFSIFSDRRSLEIENENNSIKTLTAEARYTRLESLELVYKYKLYKYNIYISLGNLCGNVFFRGQQTRQKRYYVSRFFV